MASRFFGWYSKLTPTQAKTLLFTVGSVIAGIGVVFPKVAPILVPLAIALKSPFSDHKQEE